MKTILVVDDELVIANMLRTVLEAEGYRVVMAGNGQEGLESVARNQVDLVLCDLMMPVLDGAELCYALKSTPTHQAIPIVLMSAIGMLLIPDGCPYDGFLGKPFNLDEVLKLVKQLIGGPEPR